MSRLTPGTVIVGIFAVLFGLVGAYGVRKYLQGARPAPPAAQQPREQIVPLASMDIEAGRQVVLGEVALLRLAPEQIQRMRQDNRLPRQYMTDPQQIIGRTLKRPLKQGDAFQTEDFYAEGTGPTVAERLVPGLRAVTIPVEGSGALGGYDGVGSYVDVVFRSLPNDAAGIPETTVTLLEGAQVLAMEQVGSRNPPGTSLQNRVTLAVTAAQANALKIAEGRGTFSLTLRNPEDVEIAAATVPQTLDRLLNIPPQREHTTAIFRGASRSSVSSFLTPVAAVEPAVALPIAGALQLRAAQQMTSLEKDTSEPAQADSAPMAPETAPVQPVGAPAPAMRDASDSAAAGESDGQTPVAVEVPISVQLQETPSVETVANAPVAADTARPRKVLSDIGRNQWDKPSSRRFPQ